MSYREKKGRKRKREPSQTKTPPWWTPTPTPKWTWTTPTPTPQWTTPTPPTTPIPSLPYDLALICVARVSRLYYPTLSLVSKSFRSLISSPELYKVRSLLGLTEICLYVCLQSFGSNKPLWFTLCRKPGKTQSNETISRSGYALARVPIPSSPCANFRSLVAVGSKIYNIVENMFLFTFSRVAILDCTSHTWSEAPSLRVELSSLSASVLDHKIYVAGRYKDVDSNFKNSFQVFDTKTQIWDLLPSEIKDRIEKETASIDGKFHVVTYDSKEHGWCMTPYDSKEGKWDMVGKLMLGGCMDSPACCVIGNVLYSASDGVFKWYDTEARLWRDLQGLVGLPKIPRYIRLGDYGGKMVVFWNETVWPRFYTEIWCAEIALERRNTSEIWGKVEWFDDLVKVPSSYKVEKVLATTL